MYHDVIAPGLEDSSGFPGADAARYKLTGRQFAGHLRAIAARVPAPPVTVDSFQGHDGHHAVPLLLTFDDGGSSAETIADTLEEFGCRGHFFVTAGYVGRPGFLDAGGVRRLRDRGHVIGSHSCTHPLLMARWPAARLRDEWSRSAAILSDLLGEPIVAASVPGGHCSLNVVDAAADAGVWFLFTSRPTVAIRSHRHTFVIGRYAVRRSTTADEAAAVAAGARLPRLRQLAWWDAKTAAKATAGTLYLKVRETLLGRSAQVRWGDEAEPVHKAPRSA
jgi:peptidoglycan/xylan/chitin deacetylase (PgdA/CDA1 family)